MVIIAEVKTHSPFGWESQHDWPELFRIADQVGDMIAVHTDRRWHGSFDLIKRARDLTDKPILAKGIHSTDEDVVKAVAAGADFVLVVGRIPAVYQDRCLIEPSSLKEIRTIPTGQKVVWNSRDLASGGLKRHAFTEARALFSGWLCQASNIVRVKDIEPSADGILIGTHLPELAQDLLAARATGKV